MTSSSEQPKEHCEHEEICRFFMHDSKIAFKDGTPCMRNHEGCVKCTYDTRLHPAPSTVVDDITFEGAAIVQVARKEAARKAREDFAKELITWIDQEIKDHPDDEAWYDSTLETVKDRINESLRTTTPQIEQEQQR